MKRTTTSVSMVIIAILFVTASKTTPTVSALFSGRNKLAHRATNAGSLQGEGSPLERLSVQQQAAVDKFLRANPSMRRSDRTDAQAADMDGLKPLTYAMQADFNHDGQLDIAIVFVSKKGRLVSPQMPAQGSWRQWWIVIFHGNSSGEFSPVVVHRGEYACFDGLYYSKADKKVLFGCGLYTGSFKWNGRRYVLVAPSGD